MKELIAMCDTPEIQDKWERKYGDMFARMRDDKLETVLYSHSTQDFSGSVKYNVPKSIFIPRIEDALDWLACFIPWMDSSHPDGWEAAAGPVAQKHTAGMLIKALLKVYMELEHDKFWDGSVWHK